MKTEDIVKYALLAVGGYLVWVYVISPMINSGAMAAGTGTGTGTSTGTGTGTPSPAASLQNINQTSGANPPTGNTQSGLTVNIPPVSQGGSDHPASTAATALASVLTQQAGNVQMLNPDQWAWYYNQLPGRTAITANQMASMLTNGSITDRTQPIPVGQFIGMLASVNLSGLGDIVNLSGGGLGVMGFRAMKKSGFGGSTQRVSNRVH